MPMTMANINKEFLLKHRFWLLLLLFLILWIASMCILQVTASEPLEKLKKEFEAAKKNVEANLQKKPKNNFFLKPWQEYGKKFADMKDSVWSDAWNLQKDIISWPSSATAPFGDRWAAASSLKDFLQSLMVEDIKGWQSSLARSEFKDSLYRMQFTEHDFAKDVKPVQLNGGVDAIFQPVQWGDKPPSVEEIWLAQEDLWVRTEMLGMIRSTLDAVAHFDPVPLPEKDAPPAGGLPRYRFRNSSWELDLIVEQQPQGKLLQISPRSTIKNVHVNKRMLKLANPRTNKGLTFLLRQRSQTFPLLVEGEPLAWGQSTPFLRSTVIEKINLRMPFEVEQVFDWHTAPVRRIDALQTAWNSHRTAHRPLEANPTLAAADAPSAGAAQPVPAASPPAAPPGGAARGGGDVGRPGGLGRGAAAATPTGEAAAGGIKRLRYLYRTEQCRHLPIALLAVVDQAHIHDVLIAACNSRLRIQITQVAFNHVHGITPPAEEGDRADDSRTARPGGGGNTAAAATRPTLGAVAEEDDPYLVELAVYGIATLYERFSENRTPPPGTGPGGTPPSASPPAGRASTPPAENAKGPAAKADNTKSGQGPTPKSDDTKSGKSSPPKGDATKGSAPKGDNAKGGQSEKKS